VWTNEQLEQWYCHERSYLADTVTLQMDKDLCRQRESIQQDMLQLLTSFLDGSISLRAFNQVFQQKTHKVWDAFHLRGMSGGMFLNKLVKHISEEDILTRFLRKVLRKPVDQQSGQRHMRAFLQFLEGIIASRQATRSQLQPARVPFFLSVWWHIQEVERWPIFYLETRQVLLPKAKSLERDLDLVELYFTFHARFLALKQALDLRVWELEQLIAWHYAHSLYDGQGKPYGGREKKRRHEYSEILTEQNSIVSRGGNMSVKKGKIQNSQTYIRWLLAKIGLKIGCDVWIAPEDREQSWNGDKLGDLSLSSFPLLTESASCQAIEHIDVLWLCRKEIIAAYEVEQNGPEISQSLLRLSDLAAFVSQQDTPLCVITPHRCFDQVQSELSHPIFQYYSMQERSNVIIQEYLIQHAEHILRWASSPSIIYDLIAHLSVGGL
jgi:hypothetical protein